MTKITKNEKILREGLNKWKNFLKEGAFKKVNENNPPKAADGYYIHPGRTPLRVVGGSLKGAEGKAIEITTTTKGETAIVIELTKDADQKVFGQVSDEVIVLPGDVETIGTDMGDDPKMDYYNDMPSRDGELREGGTMGEYGKMDAEQGLPPTKIGRGNEEYMAAYNAVLQARGEEPMDIQQPDQAYLDALRSGRLEERDVGMEVWMEKFKLYARLPQNQPMDEFMKDNAMYAYRQGMDPKQAAEELRSGKLEEGGAEFKVGDLVIANGYSGTITDLSIPGMATVALKRGDVSVPLNNIEKISHMGDPDVMYGSDDEYDNLEEGAGHDESILQAQNQGVAFIRGQDDRAAGKEKDPNYSEESGRNPLEVLFYNAGYDSELAENFSSKIESNEPFDMKAHMAAYENEPETIEYRKQINKLIQMVADKKGIPVEQAAEEIASYAVTYQNMEESAWGRGETGGIEHAANLIRDARNAIDRLLDREYELTSDNADWEMIVKGLSEALYIISQPMKESQGGNKVKEAIGMQNIEKRRKPAASPAAGVKINPTTTAKQFIKDKGYDKYFDLSDVFKVMALTDYLRKAGADTEEKVQAAVIDYIQHDGQSLKEGVGDKEARIRDVVKMGSWDNIDGVPLSLPQAELLVAAMDNLNDTNKKKLMAMPINKMLDIVNKMVDAGVITVDYGRAGLREMMPDRTTHSSDPELDQIEDIAKDMLEAGIQNSRIPVGLNSVASALQAQGFDATLSSGVLNIDGKYYMGKEDKFDISPDEEVRRVMGYVIGNMG